MPSSSPTTQAVLQSPPSGFMFSPARSAGVLHGDAVLSAREILKSMFHDFTNFKLSCFRLSVQQEYLLVKFHQPVQWLPDGRPVVSVTYLDSSEADDMVHRGSVGEAQRPAVEQALLGGSSPKELECTPSELQFILDQLAPSSHPVRSPVLDSEQQEGIPDVRTPLRNSVLKLPIYSARKLHLTAPAPGC